MARDVNRGADAGGHPPPQRAPSPSPAAATEEAAEGTDRSKANHLRARDRVSFSSSSRTRRPSCWGTIRIHRIGRTRSGTDEHARCGCKAGAGAGAAVAPRSLLQRNDFYCDDCNPHR